MAVLATSLLAAGCSSGGEAQSRSAHQPTSTQRGATEPVVATAVFASSPCPSDVVATPPVTVSCGSVTVPERHSRPEGRKVVLPVAVLQPPGGATHPDPIVYIDGGPGGDGVSNAERLSEQPIARSRAVVMVGQRGSPLAQPSFDCPETAGFSAAWYGQSLGTPEAVAAAKKALTACYERVRGLSPAFDTYDSATAADDLEATRRALGYDTWNLYGISYGTRLGLEVMRRHPQAGSAAHPDLYNRLGRLYERLEANPVDATVPHPITGVPTTVRWDGDRTVQAAYQAMYSTKIIPLLPMLLDSFENGQFDLATTTYLQDTESLSGSVAEGLFDAVECRERKPFTDRAALRHQAKEEPAWLLSAANASAWAETSVAECDIWKAPPAPERVTEPVHSNVPTLVLAGQYDPVTPPDDGNKVAHTLTRAWFHELPGYGHGVSLQPCGTDLVAAFFDDPSTDPALPCLAALGPPAWVLPAPAGGPASVGQPA